MVCNIPGVLKYHINKMIAGAEVISWSETSRQAGLIFVIVIRSVVQALDVI
jgi:hypothetical protein